MTLPIDPTQPFLRSPKTKMSGHMMIYRTLDKARAFNAKTQGEYIFPCPLDKIIMGFMETDHEEIMRLAQKMSDEEITSWINKQCSNRSQKDKDRINFKSFNEKPDTRKEQTRFKELRNQIDPDRTDIITWVDLIELDENRMPLKAQL